MRRAAIILAYGMLMSTFRGTGKGGFAPLGLRPIHSQDIFTKMKGARHLRFIYS